MTNIQPEPQDAVVSAALVILEQMGLSPDDLKASPQWPGMPTFAAYIPVVSAQVTAGTRKTYGSYWNRIAGRWGERLRASSRFTPCQLIQQRPHHTPLPNPYPKQ
jgi:hypothetical protein